MNKQLLQTVPLAKGKDIHNRIAKLSLYKECLAIAYSIPDKLVRSHSIAEVRSKWLEHRGDGGYGLQLQLASCLDRIEYGRLCLSKARQRLLPTASKRYDWNVVQPDDPYNIVTGGSSNAVSNSTTTIHKRHERESPDSTNHGRGKRDFVPMSNWGYGNLDPDILARNKELTDRQFFKGPHWRNRPKPMLIDELSFEEQIHLHMQPKPKIRKTPKKNYEKATAPHR